MSDGLTQNEIKGLNKIVRVWGRNSRNEMYNKLPSRDSARLPGEVSLTSIKTAFKYDYGQVEAVGFKFPRHGVFVEMGVYGGFSRDEKTFPATPWFNEVIDDNLDELTEGVSGVYSEAVINASRLKIKNV